MDTLRKDIKKEIADLKESIDYCLNFFLKAFDENSDYYELDNNELFFFGINTLKDVKALANGQQRFLKDLLKLQSKKKYRIVKEIE